MRKENTKPESDPAVDVQRVVSSRRQKLTRQQIMKVCDDARKRVSAMSREERQELLKRGMAIINAGTRRNKATANATELSHAEKKI